MENNNTSMSATVSMSIRQNNKAAIIGFVLMLAGPVILTFARFGLLGDLSKILAITISSIAVILPGIGAGISIRSLFHWKETGKLGRALAIVTVIMCNPFFYFYYFGYCYIAGRTMAGILWGMNY